MLKQLFGSEARVRILSLFMLNPASEFYLREIARRLDLPPNAVTQETKRLTKLGLLQRRRRGNSVYFHVNHNFPIFSELKAIILKTVGLGDRLRATLTDQDNIDIAFIYGSYAKNEETLESDVDLFIVGSTSIQRLTPILSQLEEELGRELNATVFTQEELQRRMRERDHFILSVMVGRKIFLIGNGEVLEALAKG